MIHRRSEAMVTLVAALILVHAGLVFSTPAEFPDTPAGNRLREVVDLMNRGDAQAAKTYIENHYAPDFRNAAPMAQHLSVYKMTARMFGQLDLTQVTESSDHEIKTILRASSGGDWIHLSLQAEHQNPHRVSSMGIEVGGPPEGWSEKAEPPPSGAAEDLPFSNYDELDTHLKALTRQNEFSGVVLVAKDGDPLFHKAFGLASKSFEVPNRLDTRFNIGSLNKLFTSVAISRLVSNGELAFDDPLGKHLDGFAKEAAEKVTIQHLLQMRSGWGDYWDNETYLSTWFRLRTVDDYMAFLRDMPLGFEPGTRTEHSNTSFEILGAIIEKASGQDYYDYIRENVYMPAGMTNTDSYDRDGPAENLAIHYTNMNPNDPDGEGHGWTNTYMLPPRGTPAGGGYSTTGDLLKFDMALRNHTLLGPKHTNHYYRRYEGDLNDEFQPPQRPFMAAGGAPGLNSLLGIDLSNGFTVVVLSNYDMPIAIEIGRAIFQMLETSGGHSGFLEEK